MEKLRVGFVPVYRFRYTDWCRKQRQSALDCLTSFADIDTVYPPAQEEGNPLAGIALGAVNTLDQAETLSDFFLARKVQALVVCPLDFGDERTVSKIAERLRVPLMLYAAKEPPAVDDISLARVSDSYCGTLSIAAGLKRRRIPFHFGGIFFHEEPAFRDALETFLRAASVVRALRGARIGQIGLRPAAFETVAYDEVALAAKFGINVIPEDLGTIIQRGETIPEDDPQLQTNLAAFKAELDQVTVADAQVVKMARLETAVKAFATANHLSALAINCWPAMREHAGISPCAVFGRLTGQGLPTACETDVMGAVAMLAQFAANFGKTPPHFIDWTIQHRSDDNRLLAWHCGNAPACLAAPGTVKALRSRNDMLGSAEILEDDSQAGLLQFQLAPGVVTLNRLVEYDGEWKMLITGGEIIPSEETLAGTWSWVRVDNHARLYRVLVEEGFMHHASMIHGEYREAIGIACRYLGIETVMV
ncbi:MAG: hypothetical protein HPY85_09005 [Anaerolineae bacterium]|nr:hypothetical protein [Anaerolineae bacterium]